MHGAGELRQTRRIGFGEAVRFWLKLGFISFGGPAGQIAIMHRELVDRRRWLSEARFLHALNYCMLLPGPEAQQLATYIGWLLHRTWGGLVAGGLFVLPSVFILMALSYVYAVLRHHSVGGGRPLGLQARSSSPSSSRRSSEIGRRALRRKIHFVVAALAFIGIYAIHVPFPVIVMGAAVGD